MLTQHTFKQAVLKDKELQDLINQYDHLRVCFRKITDVSFEKEIPNPLHDFAKNLDEQIIELYHKYRGKVKCKIYYDFGTLKFKKISSLGNVKKHKYKWNYLFKDSECTIPFIEKNFCYGKVLYSNSLKPNHKEIKNKNEITKKCLFALLDEISKHCQGKYGKIQWNLKPALVEMKMKNIYSSDGWGEFNRLGVNYTIMLIQKNKAKEFTRSLDLLITK